jgi:UrcA family protein
MSTQAKSVLASIAAAALAIGSATAYADSATVTREARSTGIQYGDLNLDRAGDAAVLYGRITSAADRVCSSRAFTDLYYTLSGYRACVADATRKAVSDVNRPQLTSFYEQQLRQTGNIRVAAQ